MNPKLKNNEFPSHRRVQVKRTAYGLHYCFLCFVHFLCFSRFSRFSRFIAFYMISSMKEKEEKEEKDKLVKLGEVERILAQRFCNNSKPSRATIIGWIEEGTLRGRQIGSGKNYYVYTSSLEKLLNSLEKEDFGVEVRMTNDEFQMTNQGGKP